MDIESYWNSCLEQNAKKMEKFFCNEAIINWHNTNERFSVSEFIRANCEYPGRWSGKIERIEIIEDLIITVVHVWELESKLSFHVTSFIRMKGDLISSIDEYWGDDGIAPMWRLDKKIGIPIKE